MHLTPANLAYFLMDRCLLGADEIVGGRSPILDASRRNRNFKVIRQGAPGLFVKQMRDLQTDAMLTLEAGGGLLDLAREIPEVARIMPRLSATTSAGTRSCSSSCPRPKAFSPITAATRAFRSSSGGCSARELGFIIAKAGALAREREAQAAAPCG